MGTSVSSLTVMTATIRGITQVAPGPAVPATLRLMRYNRRLTAAQLASRLSKDSAWVANRESARAELANNDLADYAAALGCTPELLQSEVPRPAVGRPSAGDLSLMRDRRWLESECALIVWAANSLLSLLGHTPRTPRPSSIPVDASWPVACAHDVRAELRLRGPVLDMVALVERCGVRVGSVRSSLGGLGAVGVYLDSTRGADMILVDRSASTCEQRLGLARELARSWLPVDQRSHWDADSLAESCGLELIAPTERVSQALSSLSPSDSPRLVSWCKEWGVDPRAALRVAHQGGALSQAQFRRWVGQINRADVPLLPYRFGRTESTFMEDLLWRLHLDGWSAKDVTERTLLHANEVADIFGGALWGSQTRALEPAGTG